ncbi:MAG: hypothetical protein ACO3JL_15610 [Myxococcota bacterium]
MSRNFFRCTLLAALLLVGVACTPSPQLGDSEESGRIEAVVNEGGVDIVLASLATPLRTLQVDVDLAGGVATSVLPAGDISVNVLEAGLTSPRSTLTLVVADTRRLPLANGTVARLVTDGGVTATLTRAIAGNDDGERVTLLTSGDGQ